MLSSGKSQKSLSKEERLVSSELQTWWGLSCQAKEEACEKDVEMTEVLLTNKVTCTLEEFHVFLKLLQRSIFSLCVEYEFTSTRLKAEPSFLF